MVDGLGFRVIPISLPGERIETLPEEPGFGVEVEGEGESESESEGEI